MRSLQHWRLGLMAGWLATTAPVGLAQEGANPPADKQEAPAPKAAPASKVDDAAKAVIEDLLAAQRAKEKAAEAKKDAKPTGEKAKSAEPPADPIPLRPAPIRPAEKAMPPADAKKPSNAGGAQDTAKVIDGLIENEAERTEQDRRDGVFLYEQAQAAAATGKLVEALRLARLAKNAFPDNNEINAYVLTLDKEIRSNRLVTSSHSRAKARLAAGLARGQLLLQTARYHEGEDLLGGVIEAAQLFPESANVGLYRRIAERELADYRDSVRTGRIVPGKKKDSGKDAKDSKDAPADEPGASLVATGAAAPENLRRLLHSSETHVPLWYATQKNRLAVPMTVDYRKAPLALVFEDISKRTSVPFVIDESVKRAHAHLNATLDLKVGGVPAESILDLACTKSGLEYVIMERAVAITTPAKALDYVRQYPEIIRHNWAAARMLFPEMNPELFASAPMRASQPIAGAEEEDVPDYLASGKALVENIQKLLR